MESIKALIASLHEFNPMMGHRGCRLTVTYPEIAVMQTKAVIRAAIKVQNAHPDWNMVPEIMIPLVGDAKEFKFIKKIVAETADAEIAAAGSDLKYEIGTMIEIPRAERFGDRSPRRIYRLTAAAKNLRQTLRGAFDKMKDRKLTLPVFSYSSKSGSDCRRAPLASSSSATRSVWLALLAARR